MKVLETQRLILRPITLDDAPFILRLLNDPGWMRFIGDRGVRDLDGARAYIAEKPMAMYQRAGFGMYLVELKADGEPIGTCGLVRRDGLDDVDIGFAFMPKYRSQGYALEAATASLAHARDDLRLARVVAITTTDNVSSARLLEKLGLRFEKQVTVGDDPEELRLYGVNFQPAASR